MKCDQIPTHLHSYDYSNQCDRVGYDQYIVLERYGNRLREGRKVILSNINARRLHEIQQVQKSKAIQLLSKLLDSPSRFRQHVRW